MIHDNLVQHMDEANQQVILIGAFGWDHKNWQGGFYPHDLPEDWQLSYYSNEFGAVLVPQSKNVLDSSQIEEWCEDVEDHFLFYFQYDDSMDEWQQQSIREACGKKFGGFVKVGKSDINIDGDIAVLNYSSMDLRGWKDWLLQQAPQLKAIFLRDNVLHDHNVRGFKSLVEMMNF